MQPFWSPDGLWVGFAQGQSLMKAAGAIAHESCCGRGKPRESVLCYTSCRLPAGARGCRMDASFFSTGAGGLFETQTGTGTLMGA